MTDQTVFVYVGASYWPKPDRVAHGYAEVIDWLDSPKMGALRYFGKPMSKGRPGTVVIVEPAPQIGDEPQRYTVVGSAGVWPDQAARVRFQIDHDAELAAAADARKKAKVLSENVLQQSLEPIQRAYKAASPTVRRQMLALVLEYITR